MDYMEKIKNTQYKDVRGFNYNPSNITFLRDVTEMFDEKIWERELGYAKDLGANTLRVWFDIDSHMRDEENFGNIRVLKTQLQKDYSAFEKWARLVK